MEKKIILLLLLLCFSELCSGQSYAPKQPALDSLHKKVRSTLADGYLLIHNQKVIQSWRNPACDAIQMNTASAVKSFTSVLIGILIQEGKIKSVKDPVCQYIPEWEAGCEQGVTIEHLLTMSAGLNKRSVREGVFLEHDFNKFVLQMPLDTIPGTDWDYSNEGVQLLAPIIEKASGMTVVDCFREKLFNPLGMASTSLFLDPAGNGVTFGGCKTTLEDFSKIGQLMLNKGSWNGKQLLSEAYVEASLSPAPTNKLYGYLWWLQESTNSYAAFGDYGQVCIVFPDLNLMFVRYQTCSNNDQSRNIWSWMNHDFRQMVRNVVEPVKGENQR